jgi:hypothetical protein
LITEQTEMTLAEVQAGLIERGAPGGIATVHPPLGASRNHAQNQERI